MDKYPIDKILDTIIITYKGPKKDKRTKKTTTTMESLKEKLKTFQITDQEEKKSKIHSWQEYALSVIKDFGITNERMWVEDIKGKPRIVVKNYKAMIFRHACNNLEYLKGKVENAKEKFGSEGLGGKGRYLIATFRKKKPWDK